MAAVELAHLLALADRRAVAGGGVEGGDAGAAGAHLLGQGALGGQDHLDLVVEHLLLEEGVLADVGGMDRADLLVLQQQAQAEAVHAAVVGPHRQVLDPATLDLRDQVLGDAAETEAAGDHGHAALDAVHCLFVGSHTLVESGHRGASRCCGEWGWVFKRTRRVRWQSVRPVLRLPIYLLSLFYLSIDMIAS